MEIRSACIVESANRHVNHTIIKVFVLQNLLVDIAHHERFVGFALVDEIAVVEITSVDGIHINQNQQCQDREHVFFIHLITDSQ